MLFIEPSVVNRVVNQVVNLNHFKLSPHRGARDVEKREVGFLPTGRNLTRPRQA